MEDRRDNRWDTGVVWCSVDDSGHSFGDEGAAETAHQKLQLEVLNGGGSGGH